MKYLYLTFAELKEFLTANFNNKTVKIISGPMPSDPLPPKWTLNYNPEFKE